MALGPRSLLIPENRFDDERSDPQWADCCLRRRHSDLCHESYLYLPARRDCCSDSACDRVATMSSSLCSAQQRLLARLEMSQVSRDSVGCTPRQRKNAFCRLLPEWGQRGLLPVDRANL